MTDSQTQTDAPVTPAADVVALRDPDGRLIVDALGMPCPQPVLELAAAIKQLAVGDEVRLLADDPAADVDIPVWCRMRRQLLVAKGSDDTGLFFLVRKLSER